MLLLVNKCSVNNFIVLSNIRSIFIETLFIILEYKTFFMYIIHHYHNVTYFNATKKI
jgi:hypothetical protein